MQVSFFGGTKKSPREKDSALNDYQDKADRRMISAKQDLRQAMPTY